MIYTTIRNIARLIMRVWMIILIPLWLVLLLIGTIGNLARYPTREEFEAEQRRDFRRLIDIMSLKED